MTYGERPALGEWLQFLIAERRTLEYDPRLLFQQAANWHDGSVPAESAAQQLAEHEHPFGWLRWKNKPDRLLGCLTTLDEHEGSVNRIAFSPDGSLIASASADHTIRLWSARSGTPGAVLNGHNGNITECRFSHDGNQILSASADGTLRLWSVVPDHESIVLSGHTAEVTACQFSRDGTRILSASKDTTLRVWNAATGEPLIVLKNHTAPVVACALSPDGKRALSTTDAGSVRLWNAIDGTQIAELRGDEEWALAGRQLLSIQGHTNRTVACMFTPDGSRIIVAGRGIRIWDTASGALIHTLDDFVWGQVCACTMFPKGDKLIVACTLGYHRKHTFRIWNIQTGALLKVLENNSPIPIVACAVSSDGGRILAAYPNGGLRLWNAESVQPVARFTGHTSPVTACEFTPDGKQFGSAAEDSTVRLWSSVGRGDDQYDYGSCTDCNFSPDGSRILTSHSFGSLRIWDAKSGRALRVIKATSGPLYACDISQDGSRLLAAHMFKVNLLESKTGDRVRTFSTDLRSVCACSFSPDGQRILAAGATTGRYGYQSVQLWDAANGEPLTPLQDLPHSVNSCTFSPDGKRILAACDDGTLQLWDVDTAGRIQTFSGHAGSAWGAAFSHDGALIVSVSPQDRSIRIWDTESGRPLKTLDSGGHWPTSCSFSSDGNYVITCSADRSLEVYDAKSGEILASFVHWGYSARFAIADDGRSIALCDHTGHLKMLEIVRANRTKR